MTHVFPGLAGARVRDLGDGIRVCGMYDADGSLIYQDLAAGDGFEVREVIQAVRPHPGPILDLAAGTGRFTLPLLALHRPVTALDLSPHMLALLQDRLESVPERIRDLCTVTCADMTDFDLASTFAHILLGTTTVSLLDDAQRQALYGCVLRHLAPGGRFHLSVLDRTDTGEDIDTVTPLTGSSGRRYDMFEYWPTGSAHRTTTLVPAAPIEAGDDVVVVTARVGTIGPDIVEKELAAAGLTVTARQELDGSAQRTTLLTCEAAQ
ncbi:daptide-type RiPP biosynthesis methyltransferase [Streptomyces sp. URMC 123]|uniref:daptide-type RiPP biosynthesis methyltransferase n=1 Tax=Streptomyces sp. URMC 123 TaxID=3423403 RepID=UPI003F1AE032